MISRLISWLLMFMPGYALIPLAGAGQDKFVEVSVPITSRGRHAGMLEAKLAIRRITGPSWQS